ncbi:MULTISPECIES: integrating conjugative element protein [Brenneria]|uniref:Integrating conjugative element protein n=1 Tax=Brenneria nigrifluens DSM 30175 = ATCC 13028 TaxID=1121120 RepID=A0A2U1UH84_9GAMM|nr:MULTISPECIES: integrating conjugative element protein [Brenneria]EHD22935.1 integrating conjugative element protein, PFL_4711 family [Brenneria sp. EniD312]MCG8708803.1 integrating conjugative element protein [Brenneria bubanii]PWC21029.1 integrating conjugative element protein [Brenneria nigrifluens DSM 30175 = ATCC 13028]QCR06132.1 integrating conjugative element protein [Brenneria nigrifluens DSM 30175 = ATCC 13028]
MQKTEKNQFSRRRYRALSLMVTGSLLMTGTTGSRNVFADDNDTLFGVSLPQVNESNMGYGLNSSGAVSDKLFYSLGGGSVISQPATRSNMQRLGMNLGWSSDLMCGNFDLKTTVGNQLNGVTSGFKNLMSEVIQGATGAVASLPAMIIQRANPGLYEMLTNGVLQGGVAFDKAQLNCQNLSKRMMDMADTGSWSQAAAMEEAKSLVNGGDADAVRSMNATEKVTGESGQTWIGGQKRGGAGQPSIKPTHDLAAAGYNMMNGQAVTSTSSVTGSSCTGGACAKYANSEEAAAAVVKVLGDASLRTCKDANACTSGDSTEQPGSTVAGTGFAPMLEDATKTNNEQLAKLVNGTEKPNATNLAKLKTGSLAVTAGVIKALQRDPDNAALVGRLASELAMADTIETAFIMRRMITTGMSEPNAAALKTAMEEGGRRIEALDREIAALKNEMEMKREISRNAVLTIIERENNRVETNPQRQSTDSLDTKFNRLAVPESDQ